MPAPLGWGLRCPGKGHCVRTQPCHVHVSKKWPGCGRSRRSSRLQPSPEPLLPMDFPPWHGWQCPAGRAVPFPAAREWDVPLVVTFVLCSLPSLQGTDTFPSVHCRLPGWHHGCHGHLPPGHGPCPHGCHAQGDVSTSCTILGGLFIRSRGFIAIFLGGSFLAGRNKTPGCEQQFQRCGCGRRWMQGDPRDSTARLWES